MLPAKDVKAVVIPLCLTYTMMCKSNYGLGFNLDLSPIFIENGLDLNLT